MGTCRLTINKIKLTVKLRSAWRWTNYFRSSNIADIPECFFLFVLSHFFQREKIFSFQPMNRSDWKNYDQKGNVHSFIYGINLTKWNGHLYFRPNVRIFIICKNYMYARIFKRKHLSWETYVYRVSLWFVHIL